MYVCLCQGVTDSHIKKCVEEGASSVRHVSKALGVAQQCGRCAQETKIIINQALKMKSDLGYCVA